MPQAALPPNEAQRIAALRALHILDTPGEERFDRITRLAQRLFDVPIALVSLVDENRQWFKSCIGLDMSETPRSESFCAYAILGDDTLVIPDALRDPRFAGNRLVTGEPHIRFYAGHPLADLNGHKFGTLCIIDRRARQMSAGDLETLRDLAALAENELNSTELNRVLAMQRASEVRIRTVMNNVAESIITFDEHGKIESSNHAAKLLFGYGVSEIVGEAVGTLVPGLVKPRPDRHASRQPGNISAVLGQSHEMMGRRKNGTTFPMALTVSEMYLENRRLFIAIMRDITESKQANERIRQQLNFTRAITNSLNSGLVALEQEAQITFVNPAAERILGWSRSELLGKRLHELIYQWQTDDGRTPLDDHQLLKAIRSGADVSVDDDTFTRKDGSTFSAAYRLTPILRNGRQAGSVMSFRDITERNRAEEAQYRLASIVEN